MVCEMALIDQYKKNQQWYIFVKKGKHSNFQFKINEEILQHSSGEQVLYLYNHENFGFQNYVCIEFRTKNYSNI
jgi:hypothetical protein